jgi:hypothetical protein
MVSETNSMRALGSSREGGDERFFWFSEVEEEPKPIREAEDGDFSVWELP